MDVILVEEHDPHVNPLGVKGVGEIALVGVAPAIANAIFHATGKPIRRAAGHAGQAPLNESDRSNEAGASRQGSNMITRRTVLAGTGGLAAIAAAGPPTNAAGEGKVEAMQITRAGSQPSRTGPADWFTGTVRIDPLFQAAAPARVAGARVTFEPGARTAWHTHPLGQTLIVTAGCGWRSARAVRSRRSARATWSGSRRARSTGTAHRPRPMTHIAIQEALDGKAVDWLEHVSDEQYRAGADASSRSFGHSDPRRSRRWRAREC